MEVCPLCTKMPYLAVRCACGVTYCSDCYTKLNRTCNSCGKINAASANNELRQRVMRCSHCAECFENTPENARNHESICNDVMIKCDACGVRDKRKAINFHFFKDHYEQILLRYGDPIYKIHR